MPRAVTGRHWLASERPVQRLLAQGAQALSDAELLAVLMGSGSAGASTLELARLALSELGGLAGVLHGPRRQFEAVAGLGARHHARAQAVLEVAKRMLRQDLARGPVMNAPARVRDFLRLSFGRIGHEVFTVLFLDAQQRLIACEELSRADQILTRELQNALKLVDVQVLDHIIVAAADSVSFAELGLL